MSALCRAGAGRWLGGFALALVGHAVVVGGLMYREAPAIPDGAGSPLYVELTGEFAAPAWNAAAGEADEIADAPLPPPEAREAPHTPSLSEPESQPEPARPVTRSLASDAHSAETTATERATESESEAGRVESRSVPPPSLVTADRTARAVQAPVTEAPVSTHAAGLRASWQGRVKAHLERHKQYPHAARARREQGTASVRFTLDRRGRVQALQVEESTGFPMLDREVRETLRRAQPLPEPPPELSAEMLVLVWRVEFRLH